MSGALVCDYSGNDHLRAARRMMRLATVGEARVRLLEPDEVGECVRCGDTATLTITAEGDG